MSNDLKPFVDAGTVHHFSSGVYAKQMLLPKGATATSHKHAYDHMSILAKGKVWVSAGGKIQLYDGPAVVEIKAGVIHSIQAVEDSVWFCIHATEETDPAKVDEVAITQ